MNRGLIAIIGLSAVARETGFLENIWVTTKYFPKKPGFFGWVRKSCITENRGKRLHRPNNQVKKRGSVNTEPLQLNLDLRVTLNKQHLETRSDQSVS